MMTTKLVNNTRAALPTDMRQNIRAAVFNLEGRVAFAVHDKALPKEINSVAGLFSLIKNPKLLISEVAHSSFHSDETSLLRPNRLLNGTK